MRFKKYPPWLPFGIIFFLVMGVGIFCGHFFSHVTLDQKMLFSFMNQKSFFEDAFNIAAQDLNDPQAQKDLETSGYTMNGFDPIKVKGISVNHHLLTPHLIADAFLRVADKKPGTIVLLSPNHFFTGKGQIISSLYSWSTPYGPLEADQKTIRALEATGMISVEEDLFNREHGVGNLVSFVKKVFPNAKVVPLIVKDNLLPKNADAFALKLKEILPEDALVVASLDFSHYLSSPVEDFQDAKSLAVMENFDLDGTDFLNIDSKPGLRIYLSYLQDVGAQKFYLFHHMNAAQYLNDLSIPDATSYINGAFMLGEKNENHDVTILSLGNLFLDQTFKTFIEKNGKLYPFQLLQRFLGGSDVVMAHVHSIDADLFVSLRPFLKRLGFGFLENNSDKMAAEIKIVRGRKLGFIFSEHCQDFSDTIAQVRSYEIATDFVTVQLGSGCTREQAHQLIDAGADFISGAFLQYFSPIEVYKNRPLLSSLGNLWQSANAVEASGESFGAGLVIGKSQLTVSLFPLGTDKNLQIHLLPKKDADRVLNQMAQLTTAQPLQQQIIQGKLFFNF